MANLLRRSRRSCLRTLLYCCAVGLTALPLLVILLLSPLHDGDPTMLVPHKPPVQHAGPNLRNHFVAPDDDDSRQNLNASTCPCTGLPLPATQQKLKSTCSPRADARGNNQKVISFVFYVAEEALRMIEHKESPGTLLRSMSRRYFDGIAINAERIPAIYGPDWIMRLYINIPNAKYPKLNQVLCQLECQYPHLDLCRVDELEDWKFMRTRSFAIWRFLPLADDVVGIFLSRDLDSRVTFREKAAVEDWLNNSTASLHIMRDHPLHGVKILGGGWGMNLDRLERSTTKRLMLKMSSQHSDLNNKFFDQPVLETVVWDRLKGDAVQHDSYFCQEFVHLGFRPFPLRRKLDEPWNFVGANEKYKTLPTDKPCPLKCRPKEHEDWIFC